jgi:hypothetical protein
LSFFLYKGRGGRGGGRGGNSFRGGREASFRGRGGRGGFRGNDVAVFFSLIALITSCPIIFLLGGFGGASRGREEEEEEEGEVEVPVEVLGLKGALEEASKY